jgi:hypothetical protein
MCKYTELLIHHYNRYFSIAIVRMWVLFIISQRERVAYIQGVSGGTVNVLGSGSMDYSK